MRRLVVISLNYADGYGILSTRRVGTVHSSPQYFGTLSRAALIYDLIKLTVKEPAKAGKVRLTLS